jgi:hypothetical protein
MHIIHFTHGATDPLKATITSEHGEPRNTDIHAGMGIVVAREEPYSFKSDSGVLDPDHFSRP